LAEIGERNPIMSADDSIQGEPGPEEAAGVGHNQVVWDRWHKKRTFVRALEGTYGKLVRGLLDAPRVYHLADFEWGGGPQAFHKSLCNPQSTEIAQSIEIHIDAIAPGGSSVKHGHMNSAVFLILKGKGFDVHDGNRLEYAAGDAMIVENACVHQHSNASSDEELYVLTMKAKPLFLFMHMIFQKNVDMPPNDPVPGQEAYQPQDL
jgi:quercetin dioxygenase-like cupin family protein